MRSEVMAAGAWAWANTPLRPDTAPAAEAINTRRRGKDKLVIVVPQFG